MARNGQMWHLSSPSLASNTLCIISLLPDLPNRDNSIITWIKQSMINYCVRHLSLDSERNLILSIRVITGVGRKGSSSSRPRSEVWNYFGYLHTAIEGAQALASTSDTPNTSSGIAYEPLNYDRIYCSHAVTPQSNLQ